MLEKLRNKIVDVINETFTKKYNLAKILQSKKGHIYLIVKRKRGRLLGEKKNAPHKKIFDISRSVFHWCSERNDFLSRKYFFNLKPVKEIYRYHFRYFIVSREKYVNKYY